MTSIVSMRCVFVMCVIATVGCDGGEPDGSVDAGRPDSALLGCLNPTSWECAAPAPGFEFGCVSICDDRWAITCNQRFEGGVCLVNRPYMSGGSTCAVPRLASACGICREALLSDCARHLSE